MTDLQTLFPRQKVPALDVPLVGGGRYKLSAQRPRLFSLLVFYRGYHCHQCQLYLRDLEQRLSDFAKRGVGVVAISSDSEERAALSKKEWELPNLRVGYGLDVALGRRWGLFASAGRPKAGISEPDLYVEPALFLVKPDRTLWFSAVQTMPIARARFEDLIGGLDFMMERGFTLVDDYPARGEVVSVADLS